MSDLTSQAATVNDTDLARSDDQRRSANQYLIYSHITYTYTNATLVEIQHHAERRCLYEAASTDLRALSFDAYAGDVPDRLRSHPSP